MKIAVSYALALAACGGDRPPLQLSTPHLRYHAHTPEDVPPGASAWIEDYRTDLLTYFGVLDSQRDAVVDYYRFRDDADLVRNAPCSIACTTDSPLAVYTTRPLDDYELVHAFLAPIGGIPPYMIGEGTARSVSCYQHERISWAPVSSWQELVRQDDSNTQIGYGELVVHHLLNQFGPARFIKYYADAHFTMDPGLFALEFERSLGVTFSSVWDAALTQSAVNPVCPCTLEPLPLDSTFVLQHPSAPIYRPLDVPDGAAVLLTLPPGSGTSLKDCANRNLQVRLANAIDGTNLAVIKVSGENYISFPYGAASERLTSALGDWVTSTCSTASPVPVSAATKALSVVAAHPGEGAANYLSLVIDGSREIAFPDTASAAFGTIDLCTDCGLTACSRIDTTPIPAAGSVVLVIRPALDPAADVMYRGIRLSFR
jgi:hypothetical protein